eukprot:Tbor_TRINITY_DN1068_c0_g1::TRINITY_DN1068_c0_g1_i1::g.12388::m.12388
MDDCAVTVSSYRGDHPSYDDDCYNEASKIVQHLKYYAQNNPLEVVVRRCLISEDDATEKLRDAGNCVTSNIKSNSCTLLHDDNSTTRRDYFPTSDGKVIVRDNVTRKYFEEYVEVVFNIGNKNDVDGEENKLGEESQQVPFLSRRRLQRLAVIKAMESSRSLANEKKDSETAIKELGGKRAFLNRVKELYSFTQ